MSNNKNFSAEIKKNEPTGTPLPYKYDPTDYTAIVFYRAYFCNQGFAICPLFLGDREYQNLCLPIKRESREL